MLLLLLDKSEEHLLNRSETHINNNYIRICVCKYIYVCMCLTLDRECRCRYTLLLSFFLDTCQREKKRELQRHSSNRIYAMSILDYLCCGIYKYEKKLNE